MVVTLPLILLAIPSIAIGFFSIGPMLYGTDWAGHHAHDAIKGQAHTFFTGIVDFYDPAKNTIGFLGEEFHGPIAFALHGMMAPAFMLTVAGFLLAVLFYLWKPDLSGKARKAFAPLVSVLENKYGFDKLWIDGFAGGSVKLGKVSRWIDSNIVDGVVNLGTCCGCRSRRAASYPIRFPLSLRLRDDHRPDCPAGRADALPALMTCTE